MNFCTIWARKTYIYYAFINAKIMPGHTGKALRFSDVGGRNYVAFWGDSVTWGRNNVASWGIDYT